MKCLDLTLPSPAANLACDEALLDLCENGFDHEIIRFWQPKDHFVVLGYANKVGAHVNEAGCRSKQIPIVRRCSGGGTVLQGAGCLNYSLILKIQKAAAFLNITGTNACIMNAHREAMEQVLQKPVQVQGHTDLAVNRLKFSGNAQRRKRDFLIFHGTFLLDFDLELIEELLPIPSQQPSYRQNRSHAHFLLNLKIAPILIKEALRQTWNANESLDSVPEAAIEQLVRDKYSRAEWNLKF